MNKKLLALAAVAMMTAVSAQAQRIEVMDADGHGIPLVSVLTEDGVLIGTTSLDGVLSDVRGASKVALTHVAYKPQLVSVASLGAEGRITMDAVDYGLDEVVVKPKPFNIVMEMSHWEHDSSKGREITIIYLYAAEHSYMDEAEFKSRSKELNKGLSGNMTLDALQAYEGQHNIPALAPGQQKAIESLTKRKGK